MSAVPLFVSAWSATHLHAAGTQVQARNKGVSLTFRQQGAGTSCGMFVLKETGLLCSQPRMQSMSLSAFV